MEHIAVIGVKTVGMKALCRIVVIGVKTVGMKVKPVQGDLDKCTGFTSGVATLWMQLTAGSCSTESQHAHGDFDK